MQISKTAIIRKGTKGKPPYLEGHVPEHFCTINEFEAGWTEYWSANGYEIKEGRVITNPPVKSAQLL